MNPILPHPQANIRHILPSIAANIGATGFRASIDLPAAERYVFLLIDGLGLNLVRERAHDAPYLASLLDRHLTCAAPSTTVTSLTSIGTGTSPAQHGIAGYTFRWPETGVVVSPLNWPAAINPAQAQQQPHVLAQLHQQGIATANVGCARFATSALTLMTHGATRYVAYADERRSDQRKDCIVAEIRRGTRVVHSYERMLDHIGHTHGLGSWEFSSCLNRIDDDCRQLRAALPGDVRLVITADHGMLDVPHQNRIVLEDFPSLQQGLTALAGEGRFRHLHVSDSTDAPSVAERWGNHLGDKAWVRTREQATQEGWFGSTTLAHPARFGDVVVAMRENWAVMSRALVGEWGLVGMHGSMTAAEMLVPLLVD